ncbi:MAG TPA: hypothetical protein VIX62_00830, partial [Actinomycetota bacterium]
MPRIADALERESRTVDLEQGDFERLLGRRERKQRNQRIRAGALGVFVALAMGLAFVRSLTSDPVPVDPPVEPTPAPAQPTGAGEVLTRMALPTRKDLVAQDPDSGEVRTIVDARSLPELLPRYRQDITGAAWSSDRRWVAFRRGAGSGAGALWVAYSTQVPAPSWKVAVEVQVWTASADGSTPSLVASQCCVSDGGGPVWSPDGSQIAFETENAGGTADFRLRYLVVNADGTGEPGEIDGLHVPQLARRLVLLPLLRVKSSLRQHSAMPR